jgi:hypothetical protein
MTKKYEYWLAQPARKLQIGPLASLLRNNGPDG